MVLELGMAHIKTKRGIPARIKIGKKMCGNIKTLLRDGALTQLKDVKKEYEDGFITAEECAIISNLVLYSLISGLSESDDSFYKVISYHKNNFNIYKEWINERIINGQ